MQILEQLGVATKAFSAMQISRDNAAKLVGLHHELQTSEREAATKAFALKDAEGRAAIARDLTSRDRPGFPAGHRRRSGGQPDDRRQVCCALPSGS